MALEKKVATFKFKEMLTELEAFEAQKKAAGQPALTPEQIAEKMSDWIIASSVQSTVHFMKKLPTKPEAGKIYLLKTGQYIIHNPEGKPFKGSLFDISTIPDKIADKEILKLTSPAEIAKLKNQLEDLKNNKTNPQFIVQVVKITSKMGHNPLEVAKQNAIQKKCFLLIHPDKLSAQDSPLKKYLVDNRTMADNTPVTPDFYMKTVKATLELQPKPPTVGKLVVIASFLLTIAIMALLYAAIGALVYLIAIEFAEAFAIWVLCDILKQMVILPIIEWLSSLMFSQKHAIMIAATCGMIISAALAYQFLLIDFVISGAQNILVTFNYLNIIIQTAAFNPAFNVPNPEANVAPGEQPVPDLDHSEFIANAFKKAQQKVEADNANDVPPPAPAVEAKPKHVGAAFKNHKNNKQGDAGKTQQAVPAKAANDENSAQRRRSPSPARGGIDAMD